VGEGALQATEVANIKMVTVALKKV